MFRGNAVKIVEGRIKRENRDPNLHYYDIRHSARDWGTPVSIEENVAANFFGMLISNEPINLGPSNCILLNIHEQKLFAY